MHLYIEMLSAGIGVGSIPRCFDLADLMGDKKPTVRDLL